MSDEPERIKIPHHRLNLLISDFATGIIVSGPTSDGIFHLIFHADAAEVTSGSGVKVGAAAYKVGVEEADVRTFREDKTRITMPCSVFQALYDLLSRRYGIRAAEDVDADNSKA
ncbi:MAG TPA: hypothetical protein VHJ19_08815 [Gammaproteobacteria bacterium]|jgi:hypothetical protein|nr:hypothetical protein [Gammaproteobacteria bacterium]